MRRAGWTPGWAGLALGLVAAGLLAAWANEYCALCRDVCIAQSGSGCEVYIATPNVYTSVSCTPGANSPDPCELTATTGCYTTYRICSEGYCDGATCVNEGGCTTYTYPRIDAAPTFVGPDKCT